jgi:enoyl-CoA hydratase/carnithine racemase
LWHSLFNTSRKIKDSKRSFWNMVAINLGLHFPGIGSLVDSTLAPRVARKVLLQAHKYTGTEALEDGIVDEIAPPDTTFDVALAWAETWESKARTNV